MTSNNIIELEGVSYELLESIPGGAQAEVFKVRRLDNKKFYALKVAQIWKKKGVHLVFTRISTNKERIQKEIEFLRSLNQAEEHFIVSCLASGVLTEGVHKKPAFIMPFYEQTLSKTLLSNNVPLSRRLKWVQQMIIALKYIHHQHKEGSEALIHRDFKLDNLMLTENDNIRLLDFGISKDIIKTSGGVGTQMHYSEDCVAPEQVFISQPNTNGSKIVDIGTHTDMYALGLQIYFLFTNQLPDSHSEFTKNLEAYQEEHKTLLNKDNIGLLGKKGGCSDAEKELLVSYFIQFLEGGSGTVLEEDEEEISPEIESKYAAIAKEFADFAQKLMHKCYQQRPNAQTASYWIDNIILKIAALDKAESANHNEALSNNDPVQKVDKDEPIKIKKPNSPIGSRKPYKIKKPFFARFKKIIFTGGGVVLAGILMIAIWNLIEPPPIDPEIKQLTENLYSHDIGLQDIAWGKLRSKQNTSNNAKQALQEYEEKVEDWIAGSDSSRWTDGIIGLERSAETNDEGALVWLGYINEEGRGVEIDWDKAWTYYSNASQYAKDDRLKQSIILRRNALERKAYAILEKGGSESENEQAYKVIKQVAGSRHSGKEAIQNARLWLEYANR